MNHSLSFTHSFFLVTMNDCLAPENSEAPADNNEGGGVVTDWEKLRNLKA